MVKKKKQAGITFSKNEKLEIKRLREYGRSTFDELGSNMMDEIDERIYEIEKLSLDAVDFHLSNYKNELNEVLKIRTLNDSSLLKDYVEYIQVLIGLEDAFATLIVEFASSTREYLRLSDESIEDFIEDNSIEKESRIFLEAKEIIQKELARSEKILNNVLTDKLKVLETDLLVITKEVESKVDDDIAFINRHLEDISPNSRMKNSRLVIGDEEISIEVIEGIKSKSKNLMLHSEVINDIILNPNDYNSHAELEQAFNYSVIETRKEIAKELNDYAYLNLNNFKIDNLKNSEINFELINGRVKIQSVVDKVKGNLSYKELNSLAEANGFKYDRCTGDHSTYVCESDGKKVSVTIPQGREIGRGLQEKIIKKIKYNGYLQV